MTKIGKKAVGRILQTYQGPKTEFSRDFNDTIQFYTVHKIFVLVNNCKIKYYILIFNYSMSQIFLAIQSLNQSGKFCLWALTIVINTSVTIRQMSTHPIFGIWKKAIGRRPNGSFEFNGL